MNENMFRPPAQERAISCKTLICFLQSLVDERVTIELKDDCRVTGRLVHVDAYMNCTMTNVLIQTPLTYLSDEYEKKKVPDYFVNGTRIRYVDFGDGIEPMERIENQLKENRRENESRIENAKQSKRPKNRYQDPRRRSSPASSQSSQSSNRSAGSRHPSFTSQSSSQSWSQN